MYIPGESKEPDALQAGQLPSTNTTSKPVVTDISGDSNSFNECTDDNEECLDKDFNVNTCLNQTGIEEEIGNNLLHSIVFPITFVHFIVWIG